MSRLEKFCEKYQYTIQGISVVVTAFLSVITLVVTINMSHVQQKIDKQQIIPHLNIKEQVEYNSEEKYYDTNYVIVENTGGPVNNFSSKAIAGYSVTYYDKDMKEKKQTIPLRGYYSAYYNSGNSKDIICRITGYKNERKAYEFLNEALKYESDEVMSLDITLEKYVRVEYEDSLGEKYLSYYDLSKSSTKKIEDIEGEIAFSEYNYYEKSLDIDYLSIEKLVDLLQER